MISVRQKKLAAIEKAQNGIGVTTSARIFARRYYGSQGNTVWATARNDKINDLLAQDFTNAEPKHRFKLKSGEVAEIRKSGTFFYIAAMRHGSYDILVLQQAYREAHPEISKRRLQNENWGGKQ